jgi:hypothetical protein
MAMAPPDPCVMHVPPDYKFKMVDNNELENMPIPCVEIPQNLSWIYSEKGQTFFRKLLNIVGVPASEVNESSAARMILSHTGQNIDVVVVDLFKDIYQFPCLSKC